LKTVKDLQFVMFALLMMLFSTSSKAIVVTVSVPPLAGMIAPLLDQDDVLQIILKQGQSPHEFQMTPGDMKKLSASDLVLWVGTPVDQWLNKAILSTQAPAYSMIELNDLKRLSVRGGGLWDEHNHVEVDHEHHHHSGHDQDHDQSRKRHHDESLDGHLWMSVDNTIIYIKALSKQLQSLKPSRAKQIQAREVQWLRKIEYADQLNAKELKALQNVPYMLLHDAFQYFESRYQLEGVGSIRLNPMISPSLKRVHALRQKIQSGHVRCVFKEPQFPARNVKMVTQGLSVSIGTLDPMGFASGGAKEYLNYDQFIRQLATQYRDCLKQK